MRDERLVALEKDNRTEIVIHVNKLKEGWDVTNLYTIVPLRAANARTFYEALGWRSDSKPEDGVVFFQSGSMVFGLWTRDELAKDSEVSDRGGWGGRGGGWGGHGGGWGGHGDGWHRGWWGPWGW